MSTKSHGVARAAAVLLVGLGLGLGPSPAVARPDWHLDLEVGTAVPADIGGRLRLEGPYRLLLSTSIGYLPAAYVDVINDVVVGLHGYDRATADLIRAAIASSLIWRTRLGWRPFAGAGFYGEVGYGLITLGGGVGVAELMAVATGQPPPATDGDSERAFDVTSTLHMIDVELGWRWLLFAERLVLRGAIGFLGTLAARTRAEPQFASRNPALVRAFAAAGEQYLDDIFTRYVFTPVLSVSAGLRLW